MDAAGQVNIPSDPAPNGYVENKYTSDVQAAYEYLKRECDSTDGWSSIGTKSGVVMEKKTIAGDPSTVPLVRGQGTIKDVSLLDVIPILTHPGARKSWDARYLDGHALERYSRRSYMFYTLQKGGFMVQPRDFVGVQDMFFEEDGTVYIPQGSIPNPDIAPDASGKTRGWLTAAGWRLRPNGTGTDLSYIVKVNPKGSLPGTIVNSVVQEIPNCVVNVINLINNDGLIPYVSSPTDVKSVFRLESYDHNSKKKYTVAMICAEGGEELTFKVDDAKRYKKGFVVSVEGEAKDLVKVEQGTSEVKVTFPAEAGGKKVDIIVTEK